MANSRFGISRRQFTWLLGAAGVACSALAWQWGPRSLALAQEFMGAGTIGQFYRHDAAEFPYDHLGDVPVASTVPRSLADTRVRQYDELDRPRFSTRLTHRGTQLNTERFTVVSTTTDEDAELALSEFQTAWDEFGALADTFTRAHRNPDFGIGQLLIVIESEPERDQPSGTLQIENGQTIVYINVAPGQPALEEQLPELRQGAVHALLHLAELDRKFPVWAQQGLAEYAADKIARRQQMEAERELADDEAEFDPQIQTFDEQLPENDAFAREIGPRFDDEADDDASALREQTAFAGLTPVGGEYWRLQRVAPDRLQDPASEEPGEAFERTKFLLEGDDAEHAPAFLLGLRELAEGATDPLLASRAQLDHTQLLKTPRETVVDELADDLEESFLAWRADPLRGQPLFLPGGDIPDSAMLGREKGMEVVLKLAQRAEQKLSFESNFQPRVTEFDADGQREVAFTGSAGQAIDVERLFHQLTESDLPWATVNADGELLLWTDEDALAEALGVEENRYSTEFRDGRWVLVTAWDDNTQLEAWLEPNVNNPSRPLVKFSARTKDQIVKVAELERERR